MELNGVANLKILLDLLNDQMVNDDEQLGVAAKMYQQLHILEAYMKEYNEWVSKNTNKTDDNRPPYWHEVRKKVGQ